MTPAQRVLHHRRNGTLRNPGEKTAAVIPLSEQAAKKVVIAKASHSETDNDSSDEDDEPYDDGREEFYKDGIGFGGEDVDQLSPE